MKKILVFVLLLITCCECTYTQIRVDTAAYRYFPFNVGNYFVYKKARTMFPDVNVSLYINYSTVFNGHRYFRITGDPINGLWRYDSLSGNLRQYDSALNVECRVDSLWAGYGTIMGSCFVSPYVKCTSDGNSVTVLGYSTIEKGYTSNNQPPPYHIRKYAKNIGMYYYYYYGNLVNEYTYTLLACIVNGVKHGDTTLLSTKTLSEEIPQSFSLSQNYPNPFNPVTKIKFAIPLSRGVSEGRGVLAKLIIYDILGREVTTLVNEQLNPGTYEVEWSATGGGSNYPSGVYFYKLITEGYSETRKMVLIK